MEESSYDLIAAIQTLPSKSTISWQHHQIKGHQDREQGIDTLDQWALLNIEADGLAKSIFLELVNKLATIISLRNHGLFGIKIRR